MLGCFYQHPVVVLGYCLHLGDYLHLVPEEDAVAWLDNAILVDVSFLHLVHQAPVALVQMSAAATQWVQDSL